MTGTSRLARAYGDHRVVGVRCTYAETLGGAMSREHTEELAAIKRGGNAEIRRKAELVARIEQVARGISAQKVLALLGLIEELVIDRLEDVPVAVVPAGARIAIREIVAHNA